MKLYIVSGLLVTAILSGCTIEERPQIIVPPPHQHLIVTPLPTPAETPQPSAVIIEKKKR